MAKTKSVGVSIPDSAIDALDALAESPGMGRSDLIRQSVDMALPFIAIRSKIDVWRLVANIEYITLFVDTILSREHPDIANSLPEITMQRMEKFHA